MLIEVHFYDYAVRLHSMIVSIDRAVKRLALGIIISDNFINE